VADHTYKKTEIVGTSSTSSDDAIRSALAKAGQTVRNMRWFEVQEIRGAVAGDAVQQWQVTLKVGFALDD
jgi:flavin-binding protein dodecin